MNKNIAFSMKGALRLMLIAFTLCWVAACGDREAPHAGEVKQIRQDAERKIQEADRKIQEAERKRVEADKARLEAEKARIGAEENRNYWQNTAWGMLALVIVALVFGIVIGSSARKDANVPKH